MKLVQGLSGFHGGAVFLGGRPPMLYSIAEFSSEMALCEIANTVDRE
jgi:hypothetical protein